MKWTDADSRVDSVFLPESRKAVPEEDAEETIRIRESRTTHRITFVSGLKCSDKFQQRRRATWQSSCSYPVHVGRTNRWSIAQLPLRKRLATAMTTLVAMGRSHSCQDQLTLFAVSQQQQHRPKRPSECCLSRVCASLKIPLHRFPTAFPFLPRREPANNPRLESARANC